MKNSRQLREEIDAKRSWLTNLAKTLEKEEREPTDAENAQVDRVVDTELPELEAKLEQRLKFESELKAAAAVTLGRELDEKMGYHEPSKAWQVNGNGKRYAILNKGDKAEDLLGKPKVENAFGHWVLAKAFGQHPGNGTPPEIWNALSGTTSIGSGAGLVPDQLMGTVWDLARAKAVLLQAGTQTVMMNSSSMDIPRLLSDVSIATKAENAAITASDMTFGQHTLRTHTAAAMQKISRELWEDAPDLLASQIANWFVSAMVVKMDSWGLVGTGSAEPMGIVTNGDGRISETGSIGAIDWTDIASACLSVRQSNHEPTSVIMSPANHSALLTLDGGNGTDSTRSWLMEPPSVSGRSLLSTTSMSDAKIIVGDFSHYLMGMRSQPLVEVSTEAGDAFQNHQVWVKITARFDFIEMDAGAFHILTGVTV